MKAVVLWDFDPGTHTAQVVAILSEYGRDTSMREVINSLTSPLQTITGMKFHDDGVSVIKKFKTVSEGSAINLAKLLRVHLESKGVTTEFGHLRFSHIRLVHAV